MNQFISKFMDRLKGELKLSEPEEYKYLIETKALTKIFTTQSAPFHALDKINLNIKKGELLAIQGPSGCGKSTLLSILGLLDVASQGEYFLCGHRVDKLTRYQQAILRNKHIGWVFQNFNLIGEMKVQDNIALPLRYHDSIAKSAHQELVMNALEQVGLADKAMAYPGQLSGGQQQRVAIARAIVAKPDIIIADEPTGNLDSKNAEVIFQLLKELHSRNSTVLMVTHDQMLASRCERVINLLDGKIQLQQAKEKRVNV